MAIWITILLAGAMVAADQLVKIWATAALAPIGEAALIPGLLGLRYVLNDGAAFSMFAGASRLLALGTGLLLAGIAVWMAVKKPRGLQYWAWLLVLAGGVGNLIDRVRTGLVVDYLEFRFMEFPVFNLADIFVCVGAGLLILWMVLDIIREEKEKKAQSAAAEKSEDGTV